jgi:hypothetical protein
LTRRPVRLPTDRRPLLDILSLGRTGPSGPFTPAQIDYIRRTVSRAPEVMVKVTGGGTKTGAVAAHFAYISRNGELAIETDDGYRVAGRDAQKALLNDWHLELSAGQYRGPRDGRVTARRVKLVHNIVFSMPSPTPPEKVLAAARKFAREKFALQHRYAMALHTDQQHPHVHMVVKAESEHGRRLHIDKTMLREWREDFARFMREQGIAANATPRSLRGKNKGKTKDSIFRAQRRGASHAVRARVTDVVNELISTGTVHDPAKSHLLETRRAVVAAWTKTADHLEAQGETILASEVRYFSRHLPPVLTDRERLAVQFLQHRASRRATAPAVGENTRRRDDPRTR